ncbi:cytidylate kinase [Edhazardia aedis USNM 41457]|uniref:(d)CMP kinase n=1 Tax=Edhazardia aedis (strain USNM 41457) TaxID=1003232 RepID=J9DPM6_EDHAE|nr:cytidylate kinase [Edhazardia aedis USNM 41457]|eukprot:EJW04510.1 cytidylate kinase [Edhazardia aedis USNM 41457]
MNPIKVAIDGPSGVGKSSTSQKLSEMLGFERLDSGKIYRSITYALLLKMNKFKKQPEKLNKTITEEYIRENEMFIRNFSVDNPVGTFNMHYSEYNKSVDKYVKRKMEISCDELKQYFVEKNVSIVAKIDIVRTRVSKLQHEIINSAKNGIIVDGRDIGTVIMPDAHVKIFLTASPDVRAKRRFDEILQEQKTTDINYEKVLEDIKTRDYNDINRKIGPLLKAKDAIEIDCSYMTFNEQVQKIYDAVVEQKNSMKA